MAVAGALYAAVPQRQLIVTQQDHTLVDDCEHFHTHTLTSFPSERHAREQRELSLGAAEKLRVRAGEQGGISIRGWDRPGARLTVCKYAAALTDAQAQRLLDGVNVHERGQDIFASGPEMNERQAWWVHMVLNVPRRATLDLASANGGIAIRNMNGRITAHATNGGISLASSTGDARLFTENGGISLDRISGRTEATTENGSITLAEGGGEIALRTGRGGISIHLSDSWHGPGLDAHSADGELRLHVRDKLPATIEAKTSDDRGIICNLKSCSDGLGSWGPDRKVLRIGRATPIIRLSTLHAPITIEMP